MFSYSTQMVISQNSGFYRPLVGSDDDLSNSANLMTLSDLQGHFTNCKTFQV